jgi:hypothetical protein
LKYSHSAHDDDDMVASGIGWKRSIARSTSPCSGRDQPSSPAASAHAAMPDTSGSPIDFWRLGTPPVAEIWIALPGARRKIFSRRVGEIAVSRSAKSEPRRSVEMT